MSTELLLFQTRARSVPPALSCYYKEASQACQKETQGDTDLLVLMQNLAPGPGVGLMQSHEEILHQVA